jgi:hypothetical protein
VSRGSVVKSGLEKKLSDPKRIAQAYAAFFNSEDGDIIMEDLRRSFGSRSSHVPGDPYTTAYREGQRNVYQLILALREEDNG